jgi:hypothetical protein
VRLSLLETGFWYTGVLRAAGLPYGAVPAAVRMVQWADAHHGAPEALGHGFLARRRAHLACDASAPRLTGTGEPVVTIDGAGQSSLLVGPGALDLATVQARKIGVGAAVITNVSDLAWVGSLASHAADRGLACFLSFACAPDSDEVADLAALYSTARTVVVLPGDDGVRWIDFAVATANHDRLMAGADPAATDLDDDAFTPSEAPTPGVALVCWRPDPEFGDLIVARAMAAGACVLEPAAVTALDRAVIEHGIAVDADQWRHLATRALTTVIPSSDESLAGAGADN